MAKLGLLPTEVLSILTAHLEGYSIANLWLCGNKGLIYRMALGGVVEFNIELGSSRPAKWPRLVSQFSRLQRLRVAHSSPETPKLVHEVDIEALPRTLERLDLNFRNAECCFLGVESAEIPDVFPDPEWSPVLGKTPKLLVVKQILPRLTYLRLRGESYLGHLFLRVLPDCLTTLHLDRNHTIKSLKFLPPSVTDLRLPCLRDASVLEDLVRTPLVSLDIAELSSRVQPWHLASLPTTITWLNIQAYDLSLNKKTLDSTITSLEHLGDSDLIVPLNLTWLNASSAAAQGSLGLLPKTLTHLRFPIAPTEEIPPLPPGLKFLQLESSQLINFASQGLDTLPHQLTTLKIGVVARLDADSVAMLPRTLTKLTFSFPTENDPHDGLLTRDLVLKLPPKLRSLQHNGVFDQAAWSELPRTLEKISLGSLPLSSDYDLSNLALLKKLRITEDSLFALAHMKTLPQGLQDLGFYGTPYLSNECAAFLPRGLRIFHGSGIGQSAFLSDTFIEFLPPNLTHLFLETAEKLTDKSFKWLPRTLIVFAANAATNFQDGGIQDLPRYLRDLRMEKNPGLTDACVPHLPRGLTRLYMDSSRMITDAAVKYFPRTLTSLDLIKNSLLTKACALDLPPLLDYFRCDNRELRAYDQGRRLREAAMNRLAAITSVELDLFNEPFPGASTT